VIDFTALHRRARALARHAIGPRIALPSEVMRTKRPSSRQTTLITQVWGYITSHPRVTAVTECHERWGLMEIAAA